MSKQRIYKQRIVPAYEAAYVQAVNEANARKAAKFADIEAADLPDAEFGAACEALNEAWAAEMRELNRICIAAAALAA